MKRKLNIKIRHLNVIKTLYKIKNLKSASDEMSITPTAISKSCIEFEKIIGKTLFSRTRQGFIPNEIAKRVVESSILIEKEIDRMIKDIDNIYNKRKFVSISFQSNSIISDVMSYSLYLVRNNGMNLSINYGSREDLFSSLMKGSTDIIFASTYSEIMEDRIESRYIKKDRCVIFDNKREYSVDYLVNNWKSLQDKIWILPVRGTAMRDRFDAILNYNELSLPEKLIELNSTIGASNFMNEPDTIGMASLSYLKNLNYNIASDMESEEKNRINLDVGIFWRKDSSNVVLETANFLFEKISKKVNF